MSTLADPDTPFAVVDRNRLSGNLTRLRERLEPRGVILRPHVKTAKSVDIARLAFGGGPGPITVSTVAEAEAFADAGFTDITYAVGIDPHKLPRIRALNERGVTVRVVLDSATQAEAVARNRVPALIEVDCDGHRAGVAADSPQLIELGKILADQDCLQGVLLHAGESYYASSPSALAAAAANERDVAVQAANALRAAGLDAPIVSVGSTPTAHADVDLTGVTEVRAGTYVFFDLFMAGLGICTIEDLALSVVVTVTGHHSTKEQVFTDGGWTAISYDRSTSSQAVDQGYGLVLALDGTPIPGLLMTDASQEHGVLAMREGELPDLPIGTRVRILPNHACSMADQHQRYAVVETGTDVTTTWPRIQGW
ncbi:alanine racemase [Kineosporia babensis]|uniref:Alanine racemase n=1 Tax=Kineosporia babensis TaxID=499548 RepID=A0A9X1NJF9_9ACTN|nr:alanine racemase [Kineosporia babensis]